MTIVRFRVVQAGPLVTFQDGGRPGYMRFGVGASGPMDTVSYHTANLMVGNAAKATSIEISLGGLSLECLSGTTMMAVMGGSFQVQVDDRDMQLGSAFTFQAGETLTIKPGIKGNWCYLAFAGDVVAETWLNHTATHGPSGFGGGCIVVGQEIEVRNCRLPEPQVQTIAPFTFGNPGKHFRVVIGPQEQHFKPEALDLFLQTEFSLSGAYDRMGVRLNGANLPMKDSLSIPSEPILKGSIQISGDGVPTVLLADHQTTGGYPKIATLISADIDAFVQTPINAKFRFKAVPPETAIKLSRIRDIELASYFKQVANHL